MKGRPLPFVLLLLLWCSTAAAAATDVPPPFDAYYRLSVNSFHLGEAHISLSYNQDGSFLYQSDTHPTGIAAWFRSDRLRERSLWVLHDGTIRPLEYHYDHTGPDKERRADLRFDWRKGVVQNSVAGQTWHMAIPAGTLDKLVVQVAMMLDLTRRKTDLRYAIADGGTLKTYRFKVIGHEALQTPAGTFQTTKLIRVRDDNKRVTYLWCAPALHYLPVRIEQTESDGTVYRSTLKKVSAGLHEAPTTTSSAQ